MSGLKTAIAKFDTVGYKPYPDDPDPARARLSAYADKGDEIKLHQSEFDRLAALGAIEGYDTPDAAPGITTPAHKPVDEPTDPAPVAGLPTADQVAAAQAILAAAHAAKVAGVTLEGEDINAGSDETPEEGTNAAALESMTVADLKALADKAGVPVESKDKKADLVKRLDAAGVAAPGFEEG